jgi:hypothetical protein
MDRGAWRGSADRSADRHSFGPARFTLTRNGLYSLVEQPILNPRESQSGEAIHEERVTPRVLSLPTTREEFVAR